MWGVLSSLDMSQARESCPGIYTESVKFGIERLFYPPREWGIKTKRTGARDLNTVCPVTPDNKACSALRTRCLDLGLSGWARISSTDFATVRMCAMVTLATISRALRNLDSLFCPGSCTLPGIETTR